MARPLRIELAGGLYQVTSRGNRREAIYRDDGDRRVWLGLLGQFGETTLHHLARIDFREASRDVAGASPTADVPMVIAYLELSTPDRTNEMEILPASNAAQDDVSQLDLFRLDRDHRAPLP